jgi:serine/threonine protein kinase
LTAYDKSRVRAKKSIRIVAQEHKKRIDRTSRAVVDSSSSSAAVGAGGGIGAGGAGGMSNMMRKRSTKLWGSRLEEVTREKSGAFSSASAYSAVPESPSAAPKRGFFLAFFFSLGGPIFWYAYSLSAIFKWVRGELIGKGTYGRVYLALNATTGEMIAVKQVEIPRTASDKNDSRQVTVVQALKSESETLKDLDHPNIVQYLGFEETMYNLSM